MKIILIILFLTFSSLSFCQTYVLSELDGQTIETCSGDFSLGDYTESDDIEVTFCSNDELDTYIVLVFDDECIFPEGSGSLCIYDGATTSSPLLACYDSETAYSLFYISATAENESGCITLKFVGEDTGVIFSGTLSCRFLCQNREVSIVSSAPLLGLDGYIDLCWNDDLGESMPVQLTAAGTYPELPYSCSDENNWFRWDFGDGSDPVIGMGLTSVEHSFPNRSGYTVKLRISDSQNCYSSTIEQRVRVSLLPIFSQSETGADLLEICMGEPVELCAEYASAIWSTDYEPIVDWQVIIPDGGDVCLESNLDIDLFEPGQVLENVNDILGINMNMAHTFMGDLTFYIQCPNGQEVQLGIQGGGGANLGNPPDEGYSYSITPSVSETMQESANGQTLPAGEYGSYESLAGLIGCPLNGQWNLTICDNMEGESGMFYGWWIDFNDTLFNPWEYTQEYNSPSWLGSYGSYFYGPNDQNCVTGTYLTTSSFDYDSMQPFMFSITDDFGCTYDTTLHVNVKAQYSPDCCIIPSPNAGSDSEVFGLDYQMNANCMLGNSGFWQLEQGPGEAIFSDSVSPVSFVSVSTYGNYVFSWTEQYQGQESCSNSGSVNIVFNEDLTQATTQNKLQFSFFPNPSKGFFSVRLNKFDNNVKCSVFNNIGDVLFYKEFENREEFDITLDVAPGIYYIRLVDQQNTIVKKLIIEN